MFATERFIAVAISSVRMVPEEPTSVPATIRATLSSANPAAAAESPVKAFNREITTGMSAPPIGRTTRLPRIADPIRSPMKSPSDGSSEEARITQAVISPISSRALITCWPGTATGLVGIRSCSFPNAMFEPQNETEPITAANRIGMNSSSGKSTGAWRNSDQEISATAPPPTPL
jgi:hypothetical protein